jgi:hypothetical protein
MLIGTENHQDVLGFFCENSEGKALKRIINNVQAETFTISKFKDANPG